MPNYIITDKDITNAKKVMQDFDAQKTYEKLECANNWFGYLSEYKFKEYASNLGVVFNWNNFLKPNFDEPDFTINKKSIDIKCTKDFALWLQEPKFDYYVLALISRDEKELSICGWLDKEAIIKLIKNKKYTVERSGRKDFRIPIEKLIPMKEFEEQIKVVI